MNIRAGTIETEQKQAGAICSRGGRKYDTHMIRADGNVVTRINDRGFRGWTRGPTEF